VAICKEKKPEEKALSEPFNFSLVHKSEDDIYLMLQLKPLQVLRIGPDSYFPLL
jgi:hypothetical protein